MFGGLLSKVAAAVPKVISAVSKIKSALSAIPKMISSKIKEIQEKNKRILDKIKAEWEKYQGAVRGQTTVGAILLNSVFPQKNAFMALDFLLKSREAIVEEYPQLDLYGEFVGKPLENVKNFVKKGIVNGGQAAGKWVYNEKIPGISDFVGEFTGVREKGAKSSIFSGAGAFYNGVWVKGALGMVDGLADMVADPCKAAEGITQIGAYPEKTIPAIGKQVSEYVDKKLIHGTPEERSAFAGQAAFEIASWVVGAGEAKAASTAEKAVDVAKTAEKVEDAVSTAEKVEDTAEAAEAAQKAEDAAKAAQKAEDAAKAADKAESFNSEIKEKIPKAEGNRGKGVDIKGEVEGEDVSKIKSKTADGTPEKIDDASKVAGKANPSIISDEMKDKILWGRRKNPNKNELIGGHSPEITNSNPNYAVEDVLINADGTKKIKFTTQFPDGNLAKIKTSTTFPDTWTNDEVIDAVQKVADSPSIGVRPRDGATLHRGTVNGVQVEVIKEGDIVTSGYPTGGGASGLLAGFQ